MADAQTESVVELSAGIHRIEAELADDNESRAQGLMFRKFLPPQRGMLFVFDQVHKPCMWMRNTYLPLSVAFLDVEGRVINIEDMQPRTEQTYCAGAPARFALEMNQGWFAQRGLGAGTRINGVERLPRRPGRQTN